MAGQEPVLDRATYRSIRDALDFVPSWSGQIATLAMWAVTWGVGGWLTTWGSWAPYLLGVSLLSLGMFQAFAILHDCGHGSFSRRAWVNHLVGHAASVGCVTAYWPWVYIHREHHRAPLTVEDPAAVRLMEWRVTGLPAIVRFAWRSFLPLVAALQQLVFALYPLRMRAQGASATRIGRAAASVLALPLGLGVLWALFPSVVRLETVLPAYVGYLFVTEFFNLPHHVDRPTAPHALPPWQQGVTTRSCSYPPGFWWVSMNFNLHLEHHVFPNLPWYRLPRAQALVREQMGAGYAEHDGVSWLLRQRRRPLQDVLDDAHTMVPQVAEALNAQSV